jgi:hypothetical protein
VVALVLVALVSCRLLLLQLVLCRRLVLPSRLPWTPICGTWRSSAA